MKFKQIAILVSTVFYVAAAWSGEEMHHEMKIKIIGAEGDKIHFELDSADIGFDMHEMQVGENRSVVDKEGRSILVTRTEKGFTFDVDGETIEMPAFGDHDGANVWVSKGDFTSDVDVHVMHDDMDSVVSAHMDGVMIFSGKEIDDATKQVIRTALESAGHEDVRFAGGDEDGPHQVHVIKKIVEVSE